MIQIDTAELPVLRQMTPEYLWNHSLRAIRAGMATTTTTTTTTANANLSLQYVEGIDVLHNHHSKNVTMAILTIPRYYYHKIERTEAYLVVLELLVRVQKYHVVGSSFFSFSEVMVVSRVTFAFASFVAWAMTIYLSPPIVLDQHLGLVETGTLPPPIQ